MPGGGDRNPVRISTLPFGRLPIGNHDIPPEKFFMLQTKEIVGRKFATVSEWYFGTNGCLKIASIRFPLGQGGRRRENIRSGKAKMISGHYHPLMGKRLSVACLRSHRWPGESAHA